jgi:hypothetical protein
LATAAIALFGISPLDPVTFTAMPIVFAAGAIPLGVREDTVCFDDRA